MRPSWGDRVFSLEFYPARTPKGEASFRRAVARLTPLRPDHVSVTFGAGGSTREHTFATVDWLRANTDFETLPHLSCLGTRDASIDQILERYRKAGVSHIVALRGDLPPEGDTVLEGAFRHASDLVAHIKAFGGFEVSVACYPDFHPEATSPQEDMAHFAAKVRAGADAAITQYFFDNEAYFRFLDDVHALGVSIPIYVGLMPIVSFEQIDRFSRVCDAGIPLWIRKRMEALAGDKAGQRELGIEIATRQAEVLLAQGCPGIHFYTLNRAAPILKIWKNLGISEISEISPPAARPGSG